MKKLFTLFFLFAILTFSLEAQTYNSGCTPTCNSSTCPDPEGDGEIEPNDLAPGTWGVPYYQKIDILPPPEASGYQVQWIKIRQILDLPSGLSWATNQEQLNVGTWYCCEATGTPNGNVGLFNCEVKVDARVKVLFVWTTQTNQSGGFMKAEVMPAQYTVSGGGSLCYSPSGYAISVSGSNSGATYELYRNGIATGVTAAGTSSAISFPVQNQLGVYTVIAKADYDFDPADAYNVTPQSMLGNTEIYLSNLAEITSFSIPNQIGQSQINASLGTIILSMPFGSNLSNLSPSITTSNCASVSPTQPQDFNNPVIYTVTAQDGSTQYYTVTVNTLTSNEAEITDFTIPGQVGNTIINSTNATVTLNMPYGTDVSALSPIIVVSTGASINPASGTAQNFTSPVVYTVTAQDGTTTKPWTVTVNVLLNNEAEITDFTFAGQVGNTVINSTNATIAIDMPTGTDVTSLNPTIVVSNGATINPLSGSAQNFSTPVNYTVTAENGTTKTWTTTVDVLSSIKLEDNKVQLFYDNQNNRLIVNCSNNQFNAKITDANGKLIETFTINCNQTKEIKNISKGLYFINLYDGTSKYTLKFIL